ncbi:MAG: aminotransferase class I/II-fold pyridoxal phosphate-dependent enzyme, partial [Alphaproteobacteria bacterium]|nr:aminotransferase class I/II-fold pyridoxal phosphate-dependent enzyme [Alphaproteobacteria bacterium]
MTSIANRARKAILALEPYKSARSMVKGGAGMVFLDANECPYEPVAGVHGYSRYADQQPAAMIAAIARVYDVSSRNMVVTRGADEAIDLTVRAFCEAGQDNIVICPPTFPMYAHYAKLQDTEVRQVPLTDKDFQLDVAGIKA